MSELISQKYYIGISSGFHDGAIALVNDSGEIIFAEATERYTQNKRSLTSAADNYFYSLKIAKAYSFFDYEIAINWQAYNSTFKHTFKAFVNYFFRNNITFTKWFAKNIRKQNSHQYAAAVDLNFTSQMASIFQSGTSIRSVLVNKDKLDFKKIHNFDHHLTHAYYSLYTSNYKEAIVLIIDGNGDDNAPISIYESKNNHIHLLSRNKNACSLGDYYGRITKLCGFDFIKGEQWKVMGLAPYGKINEPFLALLKKWIHVTDTNITYKDSQIIKEIESQINSQSLVITSEDIAYTGQFFYENILIEYIKNIHKKYPSQNLIISGGCALNSAANGKIHTHTPYKNVYISSAPADDGCAIGAALLNFKKHNPSKIIPHFQTNPYLGFTISDSDLQLFLKHSGYSYQKMDYDVIYKTVASYIKDGQIIAWVQGNAEFGPRSLGNRSILANPCLANMKDKINSEVKFREEFRPFAPSILEEYATDYFEDYFPTPYMERVLSIKKDKQSLIPAVTHVDGTGRLQTVSANLNLHYYNLINEFYKLTKVPVLLNTSLNVMGKPIVNSIGDIASVFTSSGIDVLVVNNYVITKKVQ